MVETTTRVRALKAVTQTLATLPPKVQQRKELANRWQEQRAYLNSVLVLAKRLADNAERTLSPQQIDYAQTIYTQGSRLLAMNEQLTSSALGIDGRSGSLDAGYRGAMNRYSDLCALRTEPSVVADVNSYRRDITPRRLDNHGRGDLAGKALLIVDPNIGDVYRLTAVLERQGMITHHAACANTAVRLLSKTPEVEMVLLGVTPAEPDLSARIVRLRGSSDAHASLPIIVMGAEPTIGSKSVTTLSGASDTLAKPINSEQLLALLRSWLIRLD